MGGRSIESETGAENVCEADKRAQRAKEAEAGQLGDSEDNPPGNETQPNS
jgi:hypothetical protein